MDWNAYRTEYAAYCSASARAGYRSQAGLPAEQPLAALHERYSDLFRPASVAEVEQFAADFFTETERRSAQALRDALRLGYLEAETRAVADEIARYEASLRLDWQGQAVNATNFSATLTQQTSPALRHDLAARWGELVSNGDDLRLERLHLRQQAAQTLGLSGEPELRAVIANLDFSSLARGAESFLQQTESVYHATLNDNAFRFWPGARRDQLSYADWLYLICQPQPQPFFPARDLLPAYSDVLRGWGWRAGRQTNLRIEPAGAVAACFAVQPPEEIYLTYTVRNGVSAYREFFAAAGRAQQHAWTSRALLAQHPAFVFAPDTALNEGYAALFRAFFCDAAWLREYRAGLDAEPARRLARDEAWLILAQARRDCALLAYELAVYAQGNDAAAPELYSAGLAQATGFRQDAAFALAEISAPFACANRLRGLLFAASVGEYLRVRYGRRWWAARRAGDELADWWNTGSRYHAEELAQLAGAGELSFDWLAETLTTSV